MQFEGEHRQIELRGIERNMANGVGQDGGMEEVINLIPRNGSYIPYTPHDVQVDYSDFITSDVKIVRVHHTSTGDNTIIAYSDYYLINPSGEPDFEHPENMTGYKAGTINEIIFIGNRMDLSVEDNKIEHWLWKNGEYINHDDLNIHENGQSVLPYVNFKVRRGIYDGSKEYQGARYVKVHKAFTDADTANCNQDEISKYVRELGSVGGDAMALLDSIRYMGGITGHILVAAAWRVKGSDASHPKYIMASPVLLMGAPEIYMKDGVYEKNDAYQAKPSDTYFLDMFDYNGQAGSQTEEELNAFKVLDEMSDSDDRDLEDMTESEHAFIEPLETNDPCVIRKITERWQSSVTAGQGDKMAYTHTTKEPIQQPALYAQKYSMYSHGVTLGSDEKQGYYRAVRITHGSANILEYKLSKNLPEQYKDEIDRLCIFVSPIISPYKKTDSSGVRFESDYKAEREDRYDGFFFANEGNAAAYGVYHSACGGSFSPVMKSADEIREEIKNIAGLYKVAEVQLNELKPNTWLKVNLGDGRLGTDRLVQNSDLMLKLSDIQPVGFTSGHIFGYNERLHVFNYKKDEVYRLPYDALRYFNGGGQYPVTEYSEGGIVFGYNYRTHISWTDSNNSILVQSLMTRNAMNPLISCADVDAKQITLIQKGILGTLQHPLGYYAKKSEYAPLSIGSIISGYVSDDLKPIEFPTEDVGESVYDSVVVPDQHINPDSYAYGRNEIRVSNPGSIVFEVDKNYKIGHGEIIGLARLAMGLSQDNFSKFPLVIFCTDGIYTLGVDASGQYAYTNQSPLSRVVCTNPNGICEIDGAVLFPSEFGLQIVTSDGVKPVALHANGQPKNQPANGAYQVNGLEIYHNAINHENIVQLANAIDDDDFRKYIQNAETHISYLHALNSVIVYRPSMKHPYSYLINLDNWVVVKLSRTVFFDDNDYPKQTFGWKDRGDEEFSFIQFDYESRRGNTQTIMVTRPIMLDSRHLKTAYRFVLRGSFEYNPEDDEARYAGLYVFGSLDGNHWDFLNGTEKLLTDNRFHDLGVETHHVSYKYLMVVFAGHISADSHIDGLEMTSKEKYNEKLK